MSTILEAERAYHEAERRLEERQYRHDVRTGIITLTFAAGGLLIFVGGILLGVFSENARNSFLIPITVGVFLLAYAALRIYTARTRLPEKDGEVDRTFEELENAQKDWLRSAGFEAPTSAIDELDFDLAPDRSRNTTYGKTQLIETVSGKVVPVMLRHEIAKGYVLYGPEGQLLQEHRAVGKD